MRILLNSTLTRRSPSVTLIQRNTRAVSDLAATLQLVASATPSATPLDDAADVLRREAEVCRLIAVNALRTATNFGLLGDLAGANAACAAAVTTIEKMSVSAAAKSLPAAGASGAAAGSAHALSPAHGVRSLLLDMRGQVAEALSREDWFKKWGAHYLRSLMQAHLLQQCNNFRSESVLFTVTCCAHSANDLTCPPHILQFKYLQLQGPRRSALRLRGVRCDPRRRRRHILCAPAPGADAASVLRALQRRFRCGPGPGRR